MTKAEEKRINKMNMLRKKLMKLIPESAQDEAGQILSDLLAAQTMADVESVELVVPTKSVLDKVDLGPYSLMRTTHGVLFQAKGGYSTFIDSRFEGMCQMFNSFIFGYKNKFKDEKDKELRDMKKAFADAWMQLMLAPMYWALDPDFAIEQAIQLSQFLNAKSEEWMAESKPETEEDVAMNRESQNSQIVTEMIIEDHTQS